MPEPDRTVDALRAEYGEVCGNFRMLTDIRFKLLAFLPLAAGVTTAFTDNSTAERFLISLFGLAATIGLATYNSRNDQLYDELVGRAAEIERRLGLPDGTFANRPGPWLTLRFGPLRHKVDHRTGVAIIYGASFALWLFGIIAPVLDFLRPRMPPELRDTVSLPTGGGVEIAALLLTLIVVLAAGASIKAQRKRRSAEMRQAAAGAVHRAVGRPLAELADDESFVQDCHILSGAGPQAIKGSLTYYGGLSPEALRFYVPDGSDQARAAYLVALITDLPPRWILDCATNRRGQLTSPAAPQPRP